MNDWDEDYLYYQYLMQQEWQRVQEEERKYEESIIDEWTAKEERLSYDQFGEPTD